MDDGVENLLARWRTGDQRAAQELFERYAHRLIALARSRLSDRLAQHVDPEDVVQSAYRSFFADARDGRFELRQGGDLWQLLVVITLHKLQHQVERLATQKRSVEREQHFGSEESLLGIQASVLAHEPSPVEAVALADELEHLLAGLDPVQRRICELRLQGYSLEEIAAQVRRSLRTVCRILDHVKQQLEQVRCPSVEE